jgi:hypothetical protein
MPRYKLTKLKIFGGSQVIPSEYIEYNNPTPPHEIEMYRKMFTIFLGLAPKLLNMDREPYLNDDEKIITTHMMTTSENFLMINICGEQKKIPVIKKNITFFSNSLKNGCYTPGCTNNVFLLKLDTLVILHFPIGNVADPMQIIIKTKINEFITWLQSIKDIIYKNKQLLLCGHSNGMSSATKISFIFLYLSNKLDTEIFSEIINNNKDLFDNLEQIKHEWSFLTDTEIFVCGTGGFPVLFSNEELFKNYYHSINSRYLHIVAGLKFKQEFKNIYAKDILININVVNTELQNAIAKETIKKANNEKLLKEINQSIDSFNKILVSDEREFTTMTPEERLLNTSYIETLKKNNNNEQYEDLMYQYDTYFLNEINYDLDKDLTTESDGDNDPIVRQILYFSTNSSTKLNMLHEITTERVTKNDITITKLIQIKELLMAITSSGSMTQSKLIEIGTLITETLDLVIYNIISYPKLETAMYKITLKNIIKMNELVNNIKSITNLNMELLDPFICPDLYTLKTYNYKFYVYDREYNYYTEVNIFCYRECVIGYATPYGGKINDENTKKTLVKSHEFTNYKNILIGYFYFSNNNDNL